MGGSNGMSDPTTPTTVAGSTGMSDPTAPTTVAGSNGNSDPKPDDNLSSAEPDGNGAKAHDSTAKSDSDFDPTGQPDDKPSSREGPAAKSNGNPAISSDQPSDDGDTSDEGPVAKPSGNDVNSDSDGENPPPGMADGALAIPADRQREKA